MPIALVTGISGQDGSYLAELLLSKGYSVHGVLRKQPPSDTSRIEHLRKHQKLELHYADLTDFASVRQLVSMTRPDEVYNLASQSHVKISFERPIETVEANGVGCLRLLEALRAEGRTDARFFQAASSELFGTPEESPQTERTRFRPQNPYASAKALAFYAVQNYRDAYGMFAANGILFNHESPRRGEAFVTRKITRGAARIKLGLDRELVLGNLEASRDWGHARDYVDAMWRLLQADRAEDFVIATGKSHTIREFLSEAFGYLELDWSAFVRVDPAFFRPVDVNAVVGDATRLRTSLGWEPKTTFRELVREMVDADLALARAEPR
jgi:GDPmannose 4,6-dehydratase